MFFLSRILVGYEQELRLANSNNYLPKCLAGENHAEQQINLHAVKDFYSACSNSSAINTCPRCETNILPYIPIPLYEFMASYPPVLRRNFLNICQQIKLKWQPKTEVNFARPIVYILYSSSLSLSLIIMAFVTNAQATS